MVTRTLHVQLSFDLFVQVDIRVRLFRNLDRSARTAFIWFIEDAKVMLCEIDRHQWSIHLNEVTALVLEYLASQCEGIVLMVFERAGPW